MSAPRILIAGIGNIFFGDDAFGVEVSRRLALRTLPAGVRVEDFGIRGLDLAYALLEDYTAVILVDAAPRGAPPGTLHVLEIGEEFVLSEPGSMVEPHSLDPVKVLSMAKSLGGNLQRIYLVGCEPLTADSEDMRMELSEPVHSAVDEAVQVIESLVDKLLWESNSPLDRDLHPADS